MAPVDSSNIGGIGNGNHIDAGGNGHDGIDPRPRSSGRGSEKVTFGLQTDLGELCFSCETGLAGGIGIWKPKIPIWVNFGGP
jgi:hypothetical protein